MFTGGLALMIHYAPVPAVIVPRTLYENQNTRRARVRAASPRRDIFKIGHAGIEKAKVTTTIIDGRVVYEAKQQ
jgi:hypothetical protein